MPKRPIRHLTEDQREIVERLNGLRGQLVGGGTEQEFARRYLPFSYDTWRHLRKDDYTGNTGKCADECEKVLGNLLSMIDVRAEPANGEEEFFDTPLTRAIFKSIDRARGRDSENRLVIYKAETGGGKSAICRQAARTYGSPIIEGSESMRRSYFAVCARICQAYGSIGPWKSTYKVEEEMLNILGQRNIVLIFDEANSFGPEAINALKLILNRTRATIFMAAIPAIFARMQLKSWFEAAQLIRRAEAVWTHPAFNADTIRPFFQGLEFVDGEDAALERIAEVCSLFGMYDMAKRVREELQRACKNKPVSTFYLEKALSLAEQKTEAYCLLMRGGKQRKEPTCTTYPKPSSSSPASPRASSSRGGSAPSP